MKKNVAVGVPRSVAQSLVTDAASIDEPELLIGLTAVISRQRNPPGQRDPLGVVLHEHGLLGKGIAADAPYARELLLRRHRGRQLPHRATVVHERDADSRAGQREAPKPLLDMSEFCAFCPEEAPPRRRVVEKIVHLDCRTLRVCGRARGTDISTVGIELPRGLGACRLRDEHQPRYGGDTRQGLAAEAQRHDRLEVFEARYLAGGVPRQSQLEFMLRDAAAIVADADKLRAARFDFDTYLTRTGIEAVLDEFLHHRGRAFDHLACGDLVDKVAWELLDRHAERRAV